MALDLATQKYLEARAQRAGRPLHELQPEEARAAGRVLADLVGPGPHVDHVRNVEVPVAEGSVPVRIIDPGLAASSAILFFHGGGWVIGSINDYDHLARLLALETGAVVVLVGYRKAPEDPFPAALDDAWGVVQRFASRCSELLGRDLPLVVAGDSAGGNLAAVVARRARDEGIPIAFQALIHPVLDSDLGRPSYLDPDNQLTLTRQAMEWFWDQYVPDRAQRADPDASPLRATDLRGVAPALVIVAEHDVLRDEGEAYVAALTRAAVPATLHVAKGQAHAFIQMINLLPGAAAGRATIAAALVEAGLGRRDYQ